MPAAGDGEGGGAGATSGSGRAVDRGARSGPLDTPALARYLHVSYPFEVRWVEQFDVAVELPERVRCVPGRGAHQEVAVHFLRSVAVGDEPPVRGDVELVDGRPGGLDAGEVPGHDATPVVARPLVGDPGAALVARRRGLQLRLGDVGAVELPGLQAVEVGERRGDRALHLVLLDPGARGRGRRGDDRATVTRDQADQRQRPPVTGRGGPSRRR